MPVLMMLPSVSMPSRVTPNETGSVVVVVIARVGMGVIVVIVGAAELNAHAPGAGIKANLSHRRHRSEAGCRNCNPQCEFLHEDLLVFAPCENARRDVAFPQQFVPAKVPGALCCDK
jgi:hypothetical protein